MTDRPTNPPNDRSPKALTERRLFVAVPVPDAVKTDVADLVASVKASVDGTGRPVRWVRLEGLHLTIRFLGPTPESRRAAVEEAVKAVADTARPFEVTLRDGGAFPTLSRPRALWLSVTDGADELAGLTVGFDSALAAAGWPPNDRPYRPHLTLARADGVPAGARTAAALVEAASGREWRFVAERLVLFESHTGGGPARYEPLAEERFGVVVAR